MPQRLRDGMVRVVLRCEPTTRLRQLVSRLFSNQAASNQGQRGSGVSVGVPLRRIVCTQGGQAARGNSPVKCGEGWESEDFFPAVIDKGTATQRCLRHATRRAARRLILVTNPGLGRAQQTGCSDMPAVQRCAVEEAPSTVRLPPGVT